jgi:Type IV secretion system pilin
MRRTLALTVALALLAALLVPEVADGATSLNQVIDNLRTWLIGLLVALATLLLTVGGVRYLLAAGDPGALERAKSTIKAALAGYALAALAPVLVAVLKHIVGLGFLGG